MGATSSHLGLIVIGIGVLATVIRKLFGLGNGNANLVFTTYEISDDGHGLKQTQSKR